MYSKHVRDSPLVLGSWNIRCVTEDFLSCTLELLTFSNTSKDGCKNGGGSWEQYWCIGREGPKVVCGTVSHSTFVEIVCLCVLNVK